MDERAEQALRDALAFAESIIDTMRDPLLVLDAGLRVVTASREFYQTFGVKPEETEGRLVYDLGNRQWDIPRLRTLLEEIVPRHTTFRDYEVEHVFEHIGRKVMLLNARTLYREQNATRRIVLVIEDVTERRDAEEARREAEARFTEMVKNVRDHAIFLTDPDGVITSWNVAAERVIGYTEAEAVGKHFSLIFTPEDLQNGLPECELSTAREQGRAEDERWHLRKDGTRFWALGIVTPLHDAGGRLTGFSKILRDITDRKHADEALRESEAKYRTLFDSIDEGFCIIEVLYEEGRPADYRFLEVNPAFERQTGIVGAAGRRIREIAPGHEAHWFEAYGRVAAGGEPARFQGAAEALGRYYDVYAFRVGAPEQRRVAILFNDITARQRAEAALRHRTAQFQELLDRAPMGVYLVDADLRVVEVNPAARPVFGGVPDLIGRDFDEVIHLLWEDGYADEVAGLFRRTLETGESYFTPERAERRRDRGATEYYEWRIDRITLPDGRFGVVCYFRDVSERVHREEALRDADRRKDEFLAMLGHELRNPLAALRSLTEVLRHHKPDGDGLERAHAMMDRQVGHLMRLVDDLLDVSRITRGLVEIRKEPVNIGDVADQAVEMANPAVEGRGHELNLSLPRKALRVEGDATRLTQVIFNLLNNAAKYTDPGGKIWLTVERVDGEAVVRVRDNGSGMKADLVPRVFDLFTQGERTLDRSQGGLGLGLALVKRLVEMHGGAVEARSEGPGKGSEFVVRLPALPPELEKPQPARAPGPPRATAQVARALVVDDNFDVAESMTWLLEGLAREIKMVHSGTAALELVPEWRPDIILCDIGMPGMDGYETCRRLLQVPGTEKVLIAAVSGYGSEEDRQRSKEAGFNRHLVKPIGRTTLEELVGSVAAQK